MIMIDLSSIYFLSDCHQRDEKGVGVDELQQGCKRAVKIEANINGCKGYNIESGDGYIVTIFNLDSNHPLKSNNLQMLPKPMRITSYSSDKIVFRGYLVEAMSPFGWMTIDLANYGLSIYLKNNEIEKCVLHMYDRGVDIEYLK
jgi:hypothetical protein